jgi:Calcineurin-like phosphoesterase
MRAFLGLSALLGTCILLASGCESSDSGGDVQPQPRQSPVASGASTVAAVGDIGIEHAGRATLEAMGQARPDVDIALGDFSYAGPASEGEFCELTRSKVGPDVPFEIVSGNHEEDPGEDGSLTSYADCLPDRLGAVGEYGRQYYFDLGRLARFIMISPDLTIDGVHYYYGRNDDGTDNENLVWLREAIDDARASGIRWVVVGMHKPCISVGEYYCDVYQDLFSTLIEERVDLVLSGHDHTYQRTKQLAAPGDGCRAVIVDHFDPDCVVDAGDSYEKGKGSAFVISGAGGAELYPVHANDPERGYFVAAMGRNTKGNRHGFSSLTISPRRLAVRFVGSTPGSFEDRFEIRDRG